MDRRDNEARMPSGARVEHGGRIEVRLESSDAERVRYKLELATAEAVCAGEAEVTLESGDVVLRVNPEPPEWLAGAARALLRTLWRDRRGTDPAPWPRRLTRWREGPR